MKRDGQAWKLGTKGEGELTEKVSYVDNNRSGDRRRAVVDLCVGVLNLQSSDGVLMQEGNSTII